MVNSLHEALRSHGLTIGNSQAIDLYIDLNGKPSTIFEVKTSTATTQVYGAIGQLMLNGRIPFPTSKLVLVVPNDSVSQALQVDLSVLGITILFYRLDKQVATFENLSEVLP